MPEPKNAMVAFKLKVTDREELDFAVRLEGCTLSEFIREAVLPVARDRIVAHAIQASASDAA